jgi:hypothetical protein
VPSSLTRCARPTAAPIYAATGSRKQALAMAFMSVRASNSTAALAQVLYTSTRAR